MTKKQMHITLKDGRMNMHHRKNIETEKMREARLKIGREKYKLKKLSETPEKRSILGYRKEESMID